MTLFWLLDRRLILLWNISTTTPLNEAPWGSCKCNTKATFSTHIGFFNKTMNVTILCYFLFDSGPYVVLHRIHIQCFSKRSQSCHISSDFYVTELGVDPNIYIDTNSAHLKLENLHPVMIATGLYKYWRGGNNTWGFLSLSFHKCNSALE